MVIVTVIILIEPHADFVQAPVVVTRVFTLTCFQMHFCSFIHVLLQVLQKDRQTD